MTLKLMIRTLNQLLLVVGLSALVACTPKEEAKSNPMAGGALIGVNYTDEGIQRFSVDESGGGGINPYGISGDYCCTMYPREWTPNLKVTVEWERSDGHEKDGKRWKLKTIKKIIPIEKYTEPGRVYVTFLPKDEVRVYVWNGVVGGPSYPGDLGEPTDPNETRKKTPSIAEPLPRPLTIQEQPQRARAISCLSSECKAILASVFFDKTNS